MPDDGGLFVPEHISREVLHLSFTRSERRFRILFHLHERLFDRAWWRNRIAWARCRIGGCQWLPDRIRAWALGAEEYTNGR